MRYSILGPLQVRRDTDGGPAVVADLGRPKQRALLALLVLEAGRVVPADRLVEQLWAGRPPRTAAHSVQVYVSELRRCLREGTTDPIETGGGGYRLRAAAEDVDAVEFERCVQDGRAALVAGLATDALRHLTAALDLWRGPALADVADVDMARGRAAALEELRLDALELLAEVRLRLGETAAALTVLTDVAAAAPLRERPSELLMVALYRAGRHADALRSYQRFARLLGDELGLEPSPALRRLHQRVLLHDPALLGPVRPQVVRAGARNPYKGLRPFTEADAGDFFGREELVDRVLDELRMGERLVTLVGPSGSGKSSVLRAGVLPRLIRPAARWRTVEVSLDEDGARTLEQWTRSAQPTLLVLDQLEELFLAPAPALAGRFLRALSAVLSGPEGELRGIATLRADFYDRPLQHREIADTFLAGVVTVLPLSVAQLERAIVRPAAVEGVRPEPALVAQMVADAVDRPGALPLLQYALTELFDAGAGSGMTAVAYRDVGGLGGALHRRAERLFAELSPDEQDVAELLLLRLVRVLPDERESRRRASVDELAAGGTDPVALSRVLQLFVGHRLLTVDRDPASGEATVELAHESLLREWDRYAGWVDRHRAALADREALARAVDEWEASGRHPDYLLHGRRLDRFATTGGSRLATARSTAFLEASLRRRADEEVARTRGRRRRWLVAGVVASSVVGLGSAVALGVGGATAGPEVGLLYHDAGTEVDRLVRGGFDLGVAEHDLVPRIRGTDAEQAASVLRQMSQEEPEVVVVATIQTDVDRVAREFPGVHYVVFDQVSAEPNVTSLISLDEQGSFLAGAAAAMTTRTGTVGFIGGVHGELIERFEAGYAAGARAVDPDVEVLTAYLSRPPDYEGFVDVPGGERAARTMYTAGADVVFAAAGHSGFGVFEAAADLSGPELGHLWAIGVDEDQYESIGRLPGVADPERWRRHILTSVTKALDVNLRHVLADVAADRLTSGPRAAGLADGVVDIAWTGGHLDDVRPRLEQLRADVVAGRTVVPHVP